MRSFNNANNTENNKEMNVTIENNWNHEIDENIGNNEFLEHKGFLSNLNSFVNKES